MYRAVIDPKVVADIFGKRIATRFVVIQVTVTNRSKDFEYLIHDVSLDLSKILGAVSKTSSSSSSKYELSSVELSLVRGVALYGRIYDKRNFVVRLLRGIGAVAGGLAGVTSLGGEYEKSVAVFNGPFLTTFQDVFPDLSIEQLNRLNDSAYRSNLVVPRRQAKVFVAFLPQAIFLTRDQRDAFWDDPAEFFAANEAVDLRQIAVVVDGNFIQEINDIAPVVTAVQISEAEFQKLQGEKAQIHGQIIGNFLSGSTLTLTSQDLPGVSVSSVGEPSDRSLDFLVNSEKPIAPGKVLRLKVSKKYGEQNVSIPVSYQAAAPTLTSIDPANATPGATVEVTLEGTNFLPGATQVVISGSGVTLESDSIDVKAPATLSMKLRVDAGASPGAREIRIVTPGGMSGAVPFSVDSPPSP